MIHACSTAQQAPTQATSHIMALPLHPRLCSMTFRAVAHMSVFGCSSTGELPAEAFQNCLLCSARQRQQVPQSMLMRLLHRDVLPTDSSTSSSPCVLQGMVLRVGGPCEPPAAHPIQCLSRFGCFVMCSGDCSMRLQAAHSLGFCSFHFCCSEGMQYAPEAMTHMLPKMPRSPSFKTIRLLGR